MDKIILAVETAVGPGSMSLLKNGDLVGFRCGGSGAARSSDLVADLEGLLKESNVRKEEIELFAVSTGPGSLTGARIGIASAKGLAYALDRPCFGVSVLEALAEKTGESGVSVVLPAGRENYFLQNFFYEHGKKKSETDIFFNCGADIGRQIEQFNPATLIIEKNSHSALENLFPEKSRELKVEVASDNLSECVARFFQDGLNQTETRKSIEPLYQKQEIYKKRLV